jgi:hypothetical protein
VIHHSASRNDVTPKEIAEYQIGPPDYFPGIAYHFLVYADGKVYQVNDVDTLSFHAGDGSDSPLNTNRMGVGVCLVGDFMTILPPAAQLAATRELIKYLGLPFIPHKEAYNTVTSCPGDTWDSWKGELYNKMKKTNLHFENAPSEAQRQRLAASNFGIVKMVWPCQVIPGKVCISRTWIGGDAAEWTYVEQGIAGARALFNRNLPIYQQYPGMYWVVLNEPDTSSLASCQKLCTFLVEYARLMHGNGYKIAGPETGEGRPEDNADSTSAAKISALGPAYMVMDLITCHGYYCPPQCMPDNDWHTLRYRKIKADLHAAGFNPTVKWVQDEDGIDRGVIGASGGYKNIPINQQQYLSYIQQHDAELCKDDYMLGCTIYTLNPNPLWVSFDYSGWLEDQIYALAEPSSDDLLTWAETIVIPINPQAALWQYIRVHDWVPQSQEMSHDGIPYMWAWHDNQRTLCAWQSGAVVEVFTKPN